LTDESRKALWRVLNILLPHYPSDEQRYLMRMHIESCMQQGRWPNAFTARDIAILCRPNDPRRSAELEQQILDACERCVKLKRRIAPNDGLLRTDLHALDLASLKVPKNSPLRDWLPESMWEEAAAPSKDSATGRKELQICAIEAATDELNLPRMSIPTGGKRSIKDECLKDRHLFTKDGFDDAWQVAVDQKRIRMLKHDLYSRR
jgi:hypothetical protein